MSHGSLGFNIYVLLVLMMSVHYLYHLKEDNLAVLNKKQPARITKTLSGKQRIVPAIAMKQVP